jgi:hypothetical protein
MSEALIPELHKIIMCGFDSLEPGSHKVATFLVSHFWGIPSDMAVADIGGKWSDSAGPTSKPKVVFSDRLALGGSFLPAIRADCSESQTAGFGPARARSDRQRRVRAASESFSPLIPHLRR